jgi:hypothetical protein
VESARSELMTVPNGLPLCHAVRRLKHAIISFCRVFIPHDLHTSNLQLQVIHSR